MASEEEIELKFRELAAEWCKAQGGSSCINTRHPAYLQIIDMGWDVVPLLLQDIVRTGRPWAWALEKITGENPVKPEDRGYPQRIVKCWVEWGRDIGRRLKMSEPRDSRRKSLPDSEPLPGPRSEVAAESLVEAAEKLVTMIVMLTEPPNQDLPGAPVRSEAERCWYSMADMFQVKTGVDGEVEAMLRPAPNLRRKLSALTKFYWSGGKRLKMSIEPTSEVGDDVKPIVIQLDDKKPVFMRLTEKLRKILPERALIERLTSEIMGFMDLPEKDERR